MTFPAPLAVGDKITAAWLNALLNASSGLIPPDTGWITVTGLVTGWSLSTPSMQARMIGGEIIFQGGLVNAAFSGGYTTAAQLPAGIPNPLTTRDGAGLIDGATLAVGRGSRVTTTGAIQFAAPAAVALPWKLDDISYQQN